MNGMCYSWCYPCIEAFSCGCSGLCAFVEFFAVVDGVNIQMGEFDLAQFLYLACDR